jgi:hypothetical protein
MLYGVFAVCMLTIQPPSASLRVADGIGNFEADARPSVHLVMAHAE